MTVESLAAHADVSTHTLTRRFTDQLGTSPGQWLLAQRIATPRDLLESSGLPSDAIAPRAGLSSATNLHRRSGHNTGHLPPSVPGQATMTTCRFDHSLPAGPQ